MQLDQRFIETRRAELSRYIDEILENRSVSSSGEFLAFLEDGAIEYDEPSLATHRPTSAFTPESVASIESRLANQGPSIGKAATLLSMLLAGPEHAEVCLERKQIVRLLELLRHAVAEFAYMTQQLSEAELENSVKGRMIAELL